MKFRAEIEIPRGPVYEINHQTKLLMLGSCFTDNIDQQRITDGFYVVYNPMGPLYTPLAFLGVLTLAMYPQDCSPTYAYYDSIWHCLNFASRYSGSDLEKVKLAVSSEPDTLCRRP